MSRPNRQEELANFFSQVKEDFSQMYPELEGLSDEEALEFRRKLITEQEAENQGRLKEHLEVFTDAVIAIIATIMLLEIPLPSHATSFQAFLFSIFIFLVTFFIIMDMWWDNHKLYNQVKGIRSGAVIAQFAFMASLALLPIFARWMLEEVNITTVLSYGIAVFITNFFAWLSEFFLSQSRFSELHSLRILMKRMSFRRLISSTLISLFTFGLAFINPHLAFYFYILSPILSFWHSLHPKRRQNLSLPIQKG